MSYKLTTSLLLEPRMHHTTVTLPNGKVAIIGGECGLDIENNRFDRITNNVEVWDYQTGRWTQAQPMRKRRKNHTATLLPDGRVLVVGGCSLGSVSKSAEIWDPSNGQWKAAGKTENEHHTHLAILLTDNRVMLVINPGQLGSVPTEVWDMQTRKWQSAGTLQIDRRNFTATLLHNGQVLVAGGHSYSGGSQYPDFCEIWDLETKKWEKTISLKQSRDEHTATLLPDGRLLIAGGFIDGRYLADVEIIDPTHRTSKLIAPLKQNRKNHTATLLSNGNVVIAGGRNDNHEPLTSIELWDAKSECWKFAGELATGRFSHTASLLPNDQVLFVGGQHVMFKPLQTAECWSMES